MRKVLTIAAVVFASSVFATDVYVPSDAERARWTMSDMISRKTVLEAYAIDHQQYPVIKTLEEARALSEPIYIRHAPVADAWGRPYRIECEGKSYRIVSAGADGVFQDDMSAGGTLKSFNDDAVAANQGRWLFQHWEMK